MSLEQLYKVGRKMPIYMYLRRVSQMSWWILMWYQARLDISLAWPMSTLQSDHLSWLHSM